VVAVTDADGERVASYNYEAFGTIKDATGALDNNITYTGRWLEPETGDYFYRARYYDSGVGRFLKRDPIGFESKDYNFYRYVRNDSIMYFDPLGYDCTNIKGEWGDFNLDDFSVDSIYPTFPSKIGSYEAFGPKVHLIDIRMKFSATVSREVNCTGCCDGEIRNWATYPYVCIDNQSIKVFTLKMSLFKFTWQISLGGLFTSDYLGHSRVMKAIKYAKSYAFQYALNKFKDPVTYCRMSSPTS
jgi:RHS repeat-associated protein